MRETSGETLVGDIGGTRARFGVVAPDGRLSRERSVECSAYPSLIAAAEHYLSELEGAVPVRGAIAVACPVLGDRVQMTNHTWSFSVREAREKLGLEELEALNDFSALALALPELSEDDSRLLHPGYANPTAPLAVVGAGTGLGVSAVIPVGDALVPLAAEGGHREFAAMNRREWAVAEVLRREFGRVSLERILSGPGLVNLYNALSEIDGVEPEVRTPEAVVAGAGGDGCARCRETMAIFSRQLGAVAGDLALTFGARGGVFIGGGVTPRMGDLFDRELFLDGYLGKGRFRWYVEEIPARLIVNPKVALRGAARALASRVPAGIRDVA